MNKVKKFTLQTSLPVQSAFSYGNSVVTFLNIDGILYRK